MSKKAPVFISFNRYDDQGRSLFPVGINKDAIATYTGELRKDGKIVVTISFSAGRVETFITDEKSFKGFEDSLAKDKK